MTKCYNKECENMIDLNNTDSVFCCPECKASYYNTTVEKLKGAPPKSKHSLEEWIAIFHERAEYARIHPEPKIDPMDEYIDLLNAPLFGLSNE